MSRPKLNTPEGKRAAQKWRETMEKKHGDLNKFFAAIGAEGGAKGAGPDYYGGFRANRELAKRVGKKGGMISRRTKSYNKEWRQYGEEIITLYKQGNISMIELARRYNISYGALRYNFKKRGLI